jgi:hypothetical protein
VDCMGGTLMGIWGGGKKDDHLVGGLFLGSVDQSSMMGGTVALGFLDLLKATSEKKGAALMEACTVYVVRAKLAGREASPVGPLMCSTGCKKSMPSLPLQALQVMIAWVQSMQTAGGVGSMMP